MFKKILIANRGEIACRVIRTAARMGIRTVAVYSEADQDALHVSLADEAVLIGPAPVAESYLAMDRIVDACRLTGAEAVHPGYGFLAENEAFVKRLDEEGVVFIGPGVLAISSMGDKITSKRLAEEAGVNTIPGHTEVIPSAEEAVVIARDIGYPVMLKATAGGGCKGMRIARDDQQCRDGFERATSEARTSFGDDRVFLEKYIEEPRHIEIQVLGDQYGKVIHLGERECSLQRRHQKVIEEAPSPFLDDATRMAMGNQAVALARAVGYQSAGTVEFIVDQERNFYFLEMNTRLQVEHPVTELVTGLDLVEWMIRIAAGQWLTLEQEDIPFDGWAIEARIYAEDPFRNFLPSIGRLVRYLPPRESESVRVDTGVYEGGEVSMFYDPMIAKLITHGATRELAIGHMRSALNQFYIRGVSHNISFLATLVEHDRFRKGQLSTNLIAQEYPHGFHPADVVHDDPALLVAVAATINRRYLDRAAHIQGQLPGYERNVEAGCVVVMGGKQYPVEVRPLDRVPQNRIPQDRIPLDRAIQDRAIQDRAIQDRATQDRAALGRIHQNETHQDQTPQDKVQEIIAYEVLYGGETFLVESDWQFGQPLFRGIVNDRSLCIQVERRNLVYRLFHWGAQVDIVVLTPHAAKLLSWLPAKKPPDLSHVLLSPMPGLLTRINVAVGEQVKPGQDLAIVEAMKMENVLRAEHDGKVAKILAAVGDTLAVDQRILEFE